mmetsp:Transcript_36455/g.47850  ORF Transcript_36455/g.47850 Transcript_36455/m.47850 type:complete len:102 (-) Transcript_36455:1652-1957(-)
MQMQFKAGVEGPGAFAWPQKKRSVYQLRSAHASKRYQQGKGDYRATLFKSKQQDKASKGVRPTKKAPNRPIYREEVDVCGESDLVLVVRQDYSRKSPEHDS